MGKPRKLSKAFDLALGAQGQKLLSKIKKIMTIQLLVGKL